MWSRWTASHLRVWGWICLRQGAVNCATHSLSSRPRHLSAIKIIVTHQSPVLVILYVPQSQPMLLPRHCPCCDWPVFLSSQPSLAMCASVISAGWRNLSSEYNDALPAAVASLVLVTSHLECSQFSPILQCPSCGVRADSAAVVSEVS